MPLVSEYDIRKTVHAGRRELFVPPDAIITPQAMDTADRLGVRIRHRQPPKPAVPILDPSRAIQRTLLRRSPRWSPPSPRPGVRPAKLARIAFIGAGMVGATTAHLSAAAETADQITLIDIVPGLAEATALDIEHSRGITGSTTTVRGGTSLSMCTGADIVVVTAGRPRSPGMDRSALLEVNGRVIRHTAEAISAHAPDALVVVVTNPLDEMTQQMWQASGLPDRQVIGMAGTLDSSRFRQALANAAHVRPRDVWAITLGSHGSNMVPVVSSATIKERPVRDVLPPATIDECVRSAINGGAAVVQRRKTGSAFIAPAHAIMQLIDATRGAITEPLPVSTMLHGEYGLTDVFLGVRATLGPSGVTSVIEDHLSPEELTALTTAATTIPTRLTGSPPNQ